MTDPVQSQLEKLRQSLEVLEAQRALLGDAILPALEAVRLQMAALEARAAPVPLPTEERRIVTVLFTDIVGSTSLAENLDPEDWRQVVAAVHETAGKYIQQKNGDVVQYLGDGLLALFGARQSGERDPDNAIRAALSIQNAVPNLKIIQPVQLRVGIHTGLVVLGDMGSDAKREFTATGDAMNVAARLQSAAPPGGILISHDTYRYVPGLFDLTPQSPIKVKGKSESIQTYVVHRAKPRPFRMEARGVAGVETQTVGRETEWSQLQAAIAETFDRCKVVWAQLIGEPGMGKSRLVQDTLDYLKPPPLQAWLFRARAFQGDESQAFGLIRRMWFDQFQIAEDIPLAEAEAKWLDGFRALRGPGFDEEAHALGLLVGLDFAASPLIRAMRNDPVQVKGRALVVSRTLLAAMRARAPVVILLEDLHWADPSSLEYLQQVLLQDQESVQGLFVLATARPEWNAPAGLSRHPGFMQIDLSALSEKASRALAAKLLERVQDLPEHVIQIVAERSEGVPYFAEEIVNWFLDRGIVDAHAEPWHFDPARFEESPLPATLQHLLFTRLSGLHEAQRAALQRGSVFGRLFWEGGLEAMGVPEPHVTLEQLQPRNLVHLQQKASLVEEREWSFHHALLRDVTYESVLKRERKALHKIAATWLEAQARRAGRLDEFATVLAEHAERAGETEEAANWLLRAGERARARSAFVEARRLYDRALELLPPRDLERRWRASLGRSDVLGRLGDTQGLGGSVAALLELAKQMGDAQSAQAHFRQALYLDSRGDYRAALQAYDTALEQAWRASDHGLGSFLLGCKLICQNRLGDVDGAKDTAGQVLARAFEIDDASAAKTLGNLAVYYVESGDLARAAYFLNEEVTLYRQLGDRAGEAHALSNLGYDYICLGMPEAACTLLEQAIPIYEATGLQRLLAYARLNLGLAYWRKGDYRAAQEVLTGVQKELAVTGDQYAIAAGRSYLALVLESAGETERPFECFAQARDIYASMGVASLAMDSGAGLARLAYRRGNLEQAKELAFVVWGHLHDHGPRGMEFPLRAFQTCADIFQAAGDLDLSRAAIEEGYRELVRQTDKISNAEWRQSFAENLPEHRALTEQHRQLSLNLTRPSSTP
ncbi:MAG TPA: adenylate/guanylate cyclase domain-containing protein [Anaerolineae bacterium]